MNERDPSPSLDEIRASQERLLQTLDRLNESDLAEASLLPGWTRGHVLAHVALNAHSLVNLFEWARSGVETPQYPSWDERDADIGRHSGRTRAEHHRALAAAAEAFEAAAGAVPPERWTAEVRGIGGVAMPAARFLFGRLREVEIHHVDLDAGYRPADWSNHFVRRVLEEVPDRLGREVEQPFAARADDLGIHLAVGEGVPSVEVTGPGRELLAWLLGRADGSDLEVGGETLPRVPPWR